LIDASPDLPRQLATVARSTDVGVDRVPLAGLFLTHAHMGHYLGLAHLGFEVAHTRGIPVFASPAMCAYLARNGPWEQLVRLGNVELRPIAPGEPIALPGGVRVIAFPVPHRDEYADTVAYRIEGPGATVLYVPDTDGWEAWDPPLEQRLEGVDVALLDGTFHSLDELPGRAIEDVKHPLMTVTIDRLQSRVDDGLRVVFTHLNHSNPAVDPDSAAALGIRSRGFEIARDGDRIALTRPGGR
jgi:pyrroloquinoline quinone biosynthesis protein B